MDTPKRTPKTVRSNGVVDVVEIDGRAVKKRKGIRKLESGDGLATPGEPH